MAENWYLERAGNEALDAWILAAAPDYVHPRQVLDDRALNFSAKRRLLCAWASDACAVESRPGFRWLPGTPGPISVDHVLDALKALDRMSKCDNWATKPAPQTRPQTQELRA